MALAASLCHLQRCSGGSGSARSDPPRCSLSQHATRLAGIVMAGLSPGAEQRGEEGPMAFAGWPEAALDFYEDLEHDNSKAFWTAHKDTYTTQVLGPMTELV